MDFSRMTSLRNSIKNLTGRKPLLRMPADNKDKQSRSVTFNEVPTVYKISIKKWFWIKTLPLGVCVFTKNKTEISKITNYIIFLNFKNTGVQTNMEWQDYSK